MLKTAKAVGAIALTLALAGSTPASAYNAGGYTGDGVRIRTQPRLTATVLGLGYRSHVTCMFFATQGDRVNNDPWWWYHQNLNTGVTGYSHNQYMFLYSNVFC